MTNHRAIDIALACMDEAARKKYQAWSMWQSGDETAKQQAMKYKEIRDAMRIIKNLGSQTRMEL